MSISFKADESENDKIIKFDSSITIDSILKLYLNETKQRITVDRSDIIFFLSQLYSQSSEIFISKII